MPRTAMAVPEKFAGLTLEAATKPAANFGEPVAEGYILTLLEGFAMEHSNVIDDLKFILNEGKWNVGWKSLCRMMENEL